MPPFRPLDDLALERLDDDALIAYMRRARGAGDPTAGTALAILVWGHRFNVERRVKMKVPPAHVEDLTSEIIADAIVSAFDGRSTGEFRSWLDTITRRAIADFHRRGPGRVRVEEPTGEQAVPSAEELVLLLDAVARALARLRPEHRRVVELVLLQGRPASDAAGPGMTVDNVHQIVRRFRVALRRDTGSG